MAVSPLSAGTVDFTIGIRSDATEFRWHSGSLWARRICPLKACGRAGSRPRSWPPWVTPVMGKFMGQHGWDAGTRTLGVSVRASSAVMNVRPGREKQAASPTRRALSDQPRPTAERGRRRRQPLLRLWHSPNRGPVASGLGTGWGLGGRPITVRSPAETRNVPAETGGEVAPAHRGREPGRTAC